MRRHEQLRAYWDKTGLWLMTKRLEKGTFSWPRSADSQAARISLAPEAFVMLTDGIDMHEAKMRPWYQRDEVRFTTTTSSPWSPSRV